MRSKTTLLYAVALLVASGFALAAADTKTYDLRTSWQAVRGHKSRLSEKITSKVEMKADGKALPPATTTQSYAAVEEILEAAGGGTVRRWRFSEATAESGKKKTTYRFATKPVLVTERPGASRTFKFEDGTAMSDVEQAKLADIFKATSGGASGGEIFAPRQAVRVGESWEPPMERLAAFMANDGVILAEDRKKSKVSVTLRSVRNQAGAEFGRVEGSMELYVRSLNGLNFVTPLRMKATIEFEACIDAKIPDGTGKMSMSLRGVSKVTGPSGDAEVDIDSTMSKQLTVKTVK